MDTTKRMIKTMSVGDAAVEGLLSGIGAGIVMGAFLLAVELPAGVSPLTVLGYFDAGTAASPMVGLFTHIAVSGIYGVIFGIGAMIAARLFGARIQTGLWLALGLVYGLLIFGIAEGVILPSTHSPLQQVPLWAMGIAHGVYGIILAWLTTRNNKGGEKW